jgi:WD40 repeat protein
MNAQPGPLPTTPYKGLMPYAEEDAPFFFGPDPEREIISANLMAWRLTLLYGPSGVGKSSLLRAGVVHHLRQTARLNLARSGNPEFAVVVFSTWRDDPLHGLITTVQDAVAQALDLPDLELDSPSLADALHAASQRLDGDLLIILDQFEEYFLYHPHELGEAAFAAQFSRALNRPDLRASFLIAIREDALAKLDRFKGRVPNLFDNYLRVDHLDRDAAHAAILQPVEQFNRLRPPDGPPVTVEPALVDAVLDQVSTGQVVVGEAGRGAVGTISTPAEARIETPYLQLVMTRLWDEEMRAGSHLLRLATLDRLGGAGEIVERHLDAAMRALPPTQQDAAVRIFHHLVTPSGTKIAHTVPDLADYAELPQGELTPVLEKLSDPAVRILRPVAPPPDRSSEPRYEIFHDVLAPAILDWRARTESESARAEGERALAQERQRVRRLRWGLAGLTLLLLAVIALAAFAFQQRAAAETQRAAAEAQQRIAVSRELAAAAVNNLDVDPERSVLLALHGLSEAYTREAENALHRSIPELHLLRTLTGHAELVESVAVSPDGTRLASADDAVVKIWDAATGQERLSFSTQHTGIAIFGLAFSPDGTRVATASDDQTAKVWDAATGRQLLVIDHGAPLSGLAFSPDGERLATAGEDAARVWDSASGQQLLVLTGHEDAIRTGSIHPGGVIGVLFTPDGKRLVTAGADGTARLWDAESGQPLRVISGHTNEIYIALSPDGTRLLTAGYDGFVKLWDISPEPETNEPLVIINHEQPARAAAFGPDGTRVAAASQDGAARVWDAVSGRRLLTLAGHTGLVDDLAFAPDGARLVTVGEDKTVRVWDLAPGRELLTLVDGNPTGPEYSPDGQRLATAQSDGTIAIRDSRTGQVLLALAGHPEFGAIDIVFSPDGEYLATASWDRTARLWDATTGEELFTLSGHTDFVWQVSFNRDGTRLATASQDGTAKVWDTVSGQELFTLSGHSGPIQGITYSPDGTRIATSGASDGTARVWDAATGQELIALNAGIGLVGIAFSPDGRRLAAGRSDGTTIVWDISGAEGRVIFTLTGHTAFIPRLAFSPDGTHLATASFDGTAKVWNLNTGQEWLTFSAQKAQVTKVAFSPDGARLAAGGFDGHVRVYVLILDDLVALAKSRVTRSLTTEECRRYLHMEACPPER